MKIAPRFVSILLYVGVLCAAVVCLGQVSAGPLTTGATTGDGSATEGKPETRDIPLQAAAPPGPAAQNPEPKASPPPAAPLATQPPQVPPVKKSTAEPATSAAPDSAKRYVIGPLDVLYIRVWGNQNLSGPVDVRPDGMISMHLIGEIKADGLTPEQLTNTITQRLTDFLNNPDVNIQVAKVNSKKYYIYGGVYRAGPFPLVDRTTVMDALSNAGGFKDFANTKKIEIHRGSKKFLFNYKDVSKGKNLDQDIELENGDRIFIPD
jgi:polysaccharide export outer membrane protein